MEIKFIIRTDDGGGGSSPETRKSLRKPRIRPEPEYGRQRKGAKNEQIQS